VSVASFIASQGRPRRAPRPLLPGPRGVGELVLQVAPAPPDGPGTAPSGAGQGRGRGLRGFRRPLRLAPGPRRAPPGGLEGVGEDGGGVHGPPGLGGTAKARFRCLTRQDKTAKPVPDLLERDFSAGAINEKWCGDLTELPTDEGKLYLASVLDLASRRIAGFAMGEHHDAALATASLDMAVAVRGGEVKGAVFHSDKGARRVHSNALRPSLQRPRRDPVNGPGGVVL
jgi:hypothetical protein